MSAERLKGKAVVITGGAGGAGRASSLLFAAEDARVAILDIQEDAGRSLADEITQAGGEAVFIATDVSGEAAVQTAIGQVIAEFGTIDILFNHAGTVIVKPFLETTLDDWNRLFAINVTSMFLTCRAVIPHMLEAGGGVIVNTASISGMTASALEAVYCMTKGACMQLTRSIAVEFRDRHIRCNALCPGFIRTDHGLREQKELVALGEKFDDDDVAALQGRMCEPEEIASAALFLASDDSSFVNGEMLVIDNAAMAAT